MAQAGQRQQRRTSGELWLLWAGSYAATGAFVGGTYQLSRAINFGEQMAVEVHGAHRTPPWSIACVDTGEQAMTGARIKRVQPYIGDRRFMLTYGDGLSDVDLHELLEFHDDHGKLVTVTGVHPPARFGLLSLEGSSVTRFSEKAHTENDYINGETIRLDGALRFGPK